MSSLIMIRQQPSGIEKSISTSSPKAIEGLGFDWLLAILGIIFLGGLYLDGWAHNHGRVDQSFFTPWHAFFYSGFLVIAVVLTATLLINHFRGTEWQHALPTGYQTSFLGIFIFAIGGIGDLIWHELFGIEEGLEALYSPTHLLLGLGLVFILSGPLRAAWYRCNTKVGWKELLPALLSVTCLISTFTFFMMFSHPLVSFPAAKGVSMFYTDVGQLAGVVSLMLIGALLLAPFLLALLRWQLPIGSLTLMWGVNTVAMGILDWNRVEANYMIMGMLIAVFCVEILYYLLTPSPKRPEKLRLFSFLAPTLLFCGYYGALLSTIGISWSIHLWTGSIILSGVVGWLLSYLVAPLQIPLQTDLEIN